MKVLILHQHFRTPYEGGAIRSYYLGQALVAHGIDVEVITGYNGKSDKTEMVDGMQIHYLAIPYSNAFGFYRRSIAFLNFIRKSMKLGMKLKGIDGCYAISVPLTTGIAGRAIADRFGKPLIFEVGDLWPDAPIEMGFITSGWLKKQLYKLELSIYQSAKVIVALSEPIAAAVKHKLPTADVRIIPNMSDTDFFAPSKRDPELERKYGVAEKFVVSYMGAVGIANGLEHFIACAEQSQHSNKPFHFILCGEGAQLESLKSLAANSKLTNVSFLPLRSRDGVRELMNVTDAAFISYAPYKILETGSPNKYFDALAAGKLVIVNFEGWIREEVEREQCGVFINRSGSTNFVDRMTPFLDQNIFESYKASARRLAEKKYSRRLLSADFASILQKI